MINKKRMNKIIAESIHSVLAKEQKKQKIDNININSDILDEMARINKKETGNCIFPYNAWELKIWSNDHNPPHFHIKRNGWNVSFIIESGEVLQIESQGPKLDDYNYMVSNVEEWLNSECCIMPKITNRENAMLQWEQLHDE